MSSSLGSRDAEVTAGTPGEGAPGGNLKIWESENLARTAAAQHPRIPDRQFPGPDPRVSPAECASPPESAPPGRPGRGMPRRWPGSGVRPGRLRGSVLQWTGAGGQLPTVGAAFVAAVPGIVS